MKKELVFIIILLSSISQVNSFLISGKVFLDENQDSVQDNQTLINKTMILFDINKYQELNTATNDNGYYEFNVDQGSYILSQKLDNEIVTYPELGFYYLIVNDSINDLNFSNFKFGKIFGYVYDKNNNFLDNIKVDLSNNLSYITENGYYKFNGLKYGNYTINIQDKYFDLLVTSGSIININFTLDNYIQEQIPDNQQEDSSWLGKLYNNLFK